MKSTMKRSLLELIQCIFVSVHAQNLENQITYDNLDQRPLIFPRFEDFGSYTKDGWNLQPEMALDNCTTCRNVFAHSAPGRDSSKLFMTDLKRPNGTISLINIWPRMDCCWHRYIDIQVYFNNDTNTNCAPVDDLSDSGVRTAIVEKRALRFLCNENVPVETINVENPKPTPLQITEIEAFGPKILDPKGACFVDKRERDLQELKIDIPNGLIDSRIWCKNECFKNNYRYAAVQYSFQCFCGDSFGAYGLAESFSKCDYKCRDKNENICGGKWHQNIFLSEADSENVNVSDDQENNLEDPGTGKPTPIPLGSNTDPNGKCFIDSRDRDLPFYQRIPDNTENSITWCRNYCNENNYLFAGVQYSIQCFCGNSYGKHGLAEDQGQCSYKCRDTSNNAEQTNNCGGFWRMNIYLASMESKSTTTEIPPSEDRYCDNSDNSVIYYLSECNTGNEGSDMSMSLGTFSKVNFPYELHDSRISIVDDDPGREDLILNPSKLGRNLQEIIPNTKPRSLEYRKFSSKKGAWRWFGIKTHGRFNNKNITVSFNYKFSDASKIPDAGANGRVNHGVKIAGRIFKDWLEQAREYRGFLGRI